MDTRVRLGGALSSIRPILDDDGGFTIIEVMIAIVLMMVGLLAAADSFPRLTAMSLYGKDQTRSANLGQQKVEDYRSITTSTLAGYVGDYGTVTSQNEYFDQNGNAVSATSPSVYFTRDVQVQYWPWSSSAGAFVSGTTPYTAPSGAYLFHVAVATHWPVRGQTAYTSGNSTSPNGCVSGGAAVTVGIGCVTVSSLVTP